MGIKEFYREMGQDYDTVLKRAMGSEAFLYTLLKSFEKDDTYAKLEEAIKDGQAEEIFEQAHTLKGLTLNLGLKPLYDKCSVLVEITRKKSVAGAQEAFAQIEEAYRKILTMLSMLENAGED